MSNKYLQIFQFVETSVWFFVVKLNRKFSDDIYHDKTFNGVNSLTPEQRKRFLKYELRVYIYDNYSDEEVRRMFSKLQRGTPLNLGERFNALPGSIIHAMREIAKTPFLKKCVGLKPKRYNTYPDAVRMLYYEKNLVKNARKL